MQYIAALDYKHLDNPIFLTTLARSLSQQQQKNDVRSIILHADSAYTERVIQTGVMRDEARIRAVKDLNHRLVALFADEGVSTIGINPSQRNFITLSDDRLQMDHSFFDHLPRQSVLLLSTLVQNVDTDQPAVLDLAKMTSFLSDELKTGELIIFSKSDESEIFTNTGRPNEMNWKTMDDSFREARIPDEFSHLNRPVRLTTARDFNQIPDLNQTISIH
ncbi:MAG TPA: hypothetical protein VF181_04300 [Balneolaceae bacterium]